jgi:hypothetical protein
MNLFYLETKSLEKSLKSNPGLRKITEDRLNYLQDEDGLSERLERLNADLYRDRFDSDRFSIILQKISSLDKEVWVPLKVLKNRETEIKIILGNPSEWQTHNNVTEQDKNNINLWIHSVISEEKDREKLPEIDPDFIPLTSSLDFTQIENDIDVWETESWIDSIFDDDYDTVYDLVCFAAISFKPDTKTVNSEFDIEIIGNDLFKVSRKNRESYILFSNVNSNNDKKIAILIYHSNVDGGYEKALELYKLQENRIESLRKLIKRSYPSYLVIDMSMWKSIQKDENSNLSLSPEEIELLKESSYPLFINGQAGSGKTTMLLYITAKYLQSDYVQGKKILYLTYNEMLLQNAKKSVSDLLKKNSQAIEKPKEYKLDEIFYDYKKFMLNMLDPVEKKRFEQEKYIAFNDFESKFQVAIIPNKEKYSSNLVWHVIRSYIKGYFSPEWNELTADLYKKLPKKEKTVLDASYEYIYEYYWVKWYKKLCNEEGYWDNQDLAKFILNKKIENFHKYGVIICDESQDFTKIEIEIIFRLSVFTKFNLNKVENLPIILAGDPFQTINPTGFRWEHLKTSLREKMRELNCSQLNVYFKELKNNYRSSNGIVGFSNRIQSLRKKILNVSIDLQKVWKFEKKDEIELPIFIDIEEIDKVLMNKYRDTYKIIPEERSSQILNSKIYSELCEIIDPEKSSESTLFGVYDVKGFEYDTVLIINFGKYFIEKILKSNNITDLSQFIEKNDEENDNLIEVSYFLNKLYVAVTRAKKHLYIIDTKESKKKFWDLLNELEFENDSDDLILKFSEGDKSLFEKLLNEINAKDLEDYGMYNQDAEALKRAANIYNSKADSENEIRCRSYMYKYKKQYEMAGSLFEQIKLFDEASKCYFYVRNWVALDRLLKDDRCRLSNSEAIITKYITGHIILDDLITERENIQKFDYVELIYHKISEDSKTLNHADFMYDLLPYVKNVPNENSKIFIEKAANIFFLNKIYSKSIECWDFVDNVMHDEYYIAKISIEKDQDRIKWLFKLNKFDQIVDIICSTKKDIILPENIKIYGVALFKLKKFDEFFQLNLQFNDIREIILKYGNEYSSDIEFSKALVDWLHKLNEEERYSLRKDNIYKLVRESKSKIKVLIDLNMWDQIDFIISKDLKKEIGQNDLELILNKVFENESNQSLDTVKLIIYLIANSRVKYMKNEENNETVEKLKKIFEFAIVISKNKNSEDDKDFIEESFQIDKIESTQPIKELFYAMEHFYEPKDMRGIYGAYVKKLIDSKQLDSNLWAVRRLLKNLHDRKDYLSRNKKVDAAALTLRDIDKYQKHLKDESFEIYNEPDMPMLDDNETIIKYSYKITGVNVSNSKCNDQYKIVSFEFGPLLLKLFAEQAKIKIENQITTKDHTLSFDYKNDKEPVGDYTIKEEKEKIIVEIADNIYEFEKLK